MSSSSIAVNSDYHWLPSLQHQLDAQSKSLRNNHHWKRWQQTARHQRLQLLTCHTSKLRLTRSSWRSRNHNKHTLQGTVVRSFTSACWRSCTHLPKPGRPGVDGAMDWRISFACPRSMLGLASARNVLTCLAIKTQKMSPILLPSPPAVGLRMTTNDFPSASEGKQHGSAQSWVEVLTCVTFHSLLFFLRFNCLPMHQEGCRSSPGFCCPWIMSGYFSHVLVKFSQSCFLRYTRTWIQWDWFISHIAASDHIRWWRSPLAPFQLVKLQECGPRCGPWQCRPWTM